jgi:hypothetical protein
MKLRSDHDERLKAAMAEILAVIQKHDVAAIVALTVQDQMEYLIHPNASWNCIFLQDGNLRVNSTDLPENEKKEKVENTICSVMAFQHITGVFHEGFTNCAEMLSGHFDISHIMKRFE